jgi:hypothetical protein
MMPAHFFTPASSWSSNASTSPGNVAPL